MQTMRRFAFFAMSALMLAGISPSWALVPEGWMYHSGSYAYSPDVPGWFYFNAIDVQFVVDVESEVWDMVENLHGWYYHRWPYAYSWESGHWNWFETTYSQWICEMSGGEWSIFGAPLGMMHVAGGSFTMGDTWGDGDVNELPTHLVGIDSFFMDWCEVSNRKMADVLQWAYGQGRLDMSDSNSVRNAVGDAQELMDIDHPDCQIHWNGSSFVVDEGKGGYPCVEASWYGAAAYCNYRSEKESLTPCYDLTDWSCDPGANGYRLPSESEWEYAARGGKYGNDTKYSGSHNVDSVAWYSGNCDADGNSQFSQGKYGTLPCGTKIANEIGLYDMSGNLWEWCQDAWHASYDGAPVDGSAWMSGGDDSVRVYRGGSWPYDADLCRVAWRLCNGKSVSNSWTGFRCVRTK